MAKSNIKAAFLSRDGIINKDFGCIGSIEQFEFQEDIIKFLLTLKHNNFILFIVTNQDGIGRKLIDKEDYDKLTTLYVEMLNKLNVNIKEVLYCPHTPKDKCECRKPEPGMILELLEKYNIDENNCIMIGNKQIDMQAASAANIKGFLKTKEMTFDQILEKIFLV